MSGVTNKYENVRKKRNNIKRREERVEFKSNWVSFISFFVERLENITRYLSAFRASIITAIISLFLSRATEEFDLLWMKDWVESSKTTTKQPDVRCYFYNSILPRRTESPSWSPPASAREVWSLSTRIASTGQKKTKFFQRSKLCK